MKWVYCPKCKHKLFRVDIKSYARIEVKCHSCKDVILVTVSNGKIKAEVEQNEEV